ncbi:PWWP domain protein Pdp2 [Schizosaccharomyces pombe]|uniref:PWWP domain-containing protein2 n=1 Tax=Schizosaccharomyces pombe (strain 972 / ATCC 24843) TaxID=284812 RepID=PDP2_SCHPO|nr:putative PWWP domain containing protein [Schizosaccharomyces pombe]O94312.1 RecName: Full=PWWP domain-containing protein2 [Schizosaccharomyces pombe 972h-]CAA22121.1 PWWP domain protein (predicted) [Schizosaccharomyces pombe]|eukprot:NP_596684.1 putative PWWP domain containing protein [Schizosaccharomyces pombe]
MTEIKDSSVKDENPGKQEESSIAVESREMSTATNNSKNIETTSSNGAEDIKIQRDVGDDKDLDDKEANDKSSKGLEEESDSKDRKTIETDQPSNNIGDIKSQKSEKSNGNARKETKQSERVNYKPGMRVLTKMSGFPWWPSMVVTESKMTSVARKSKPKRAGTFYPVIFFPNKEYLWTGSDSLTPLTSEAISQFLEKPKPKTASLIKAYKMAQSTPDLDSLSVPSSESEVSEEESDQEMSEPSPIEEDYNDTKARRITRKGTKKKTVTFDPSLESVPQKRLNASSNVSSNPAKKTRVSPRRSTAASKKKSPSSKRASSDEIEKDKEEEEGSVANEEDVAKRTFHSREQSLLFLRHKLQSSLLSPKQDLSQVDYKLVHNYLDKLANFQGIDVPLIQKTKIAVVVRKIFSLAGLPKENEDEVKSICGDILENRWKSLLQEISSQKQLSTDASQTQDASIANENETEIASLDEGSESKPTPSPPAEQLTDQKQNEDNEDKVKADSNGPTQNENETADASKDMISEEKSSKDADNSLEVAGKDFAEDGTEQTPNLAEPEDGVAAVDLSTGQK